MYLLNISIYLFIYSIYLSLYRFYHSIRMTPKENTLVWQEYFLSSNTWVIKNVHDCIHSANLTMNASSFFKHGRKVGK